MYPRIRDLREDTDMNQTEFASLVLNMSQTGYSKYETGENDIPTSVLIRLAMFYDTNVDYILGMTDERKPFPANENRLKILREYLKAIRQKQEEKRAADKGKSKP